MGVLFVALLLLALVVVVALLALVHAGFFYAFPIRTTTPASAPRRVAYSVHTGSYSNSGAAFRRLQSVVPDKKLFGVYYDDPSKVCCAVVLFMLA